MKDGADGQEPTYSREFVDQDFSSDLPDEERLRVAVRAAEEFKISEKGHGFKSLMTTGTASVDNVGRVNANEAGVK